MEHSAISIYRLDPKEVMEAFSPYLEEVMGLIRANKRIPDKVELLLAVSRWKVALYQGLQGLHHSQSLCSVWSSPGSRLAAGCPDDSCGQELFLLALAGVPAMPLPG